MRACTHGEDAAAREDMALASLCGGLALANAGLGAVHGFAGPLGGMHPVPHGAICAALLPEVMAANIEALRTRHPGHMALRRYAETAALLTGREGAAAQEAVDWVRELARHLDLPSLGALGFTVAQTTAAVSKAGRASSMQGNPVALTQQELAAVYRRALSFSS